MHNEPTQDSSQPSRLKFVVVGFIATVIGGGLCGLLVLFLFNSGMLNQLPGLIYPPAATVTPSRAPTPLPTGTMIPTSPPSGQIVRTPAGETLSTPFQELQDVNTLLFQASDLMKEGKFEEALPVWDDVLVQQPGEDRAYHQRAICYINLLPEEHVLQTYESYLRSALADMDTAIRLQPNNGDYYAFRHDVLSEWAGIEEYRVDRQVIVRIAHDNAAAAITLGYTNAYRFTDRVFVSDLITFEQCEEALSEIERMLSRTSPDDSSITGLYRMRAEALACLGRYAEAAQALDASLKNPYAAISKTYYKALYLYEAGDHKEALAVLNESIDSTPTFNGYRYYLRALIYYEQGKQDLALADLELGTRYTWGRMGLYAYVLGQMALDEGRQEEGIALLQTAEASLDDDTMLIRSRIIQQLAGLGAEPLEISPSITIASTPIPVNAP